MEYRAEPYRPSAAVLYTADDPSTGRALGGGLFSNAPSVNDARAVATASSLLTAGLNTVSLPLTRQFLTNHLCAHDLALRICILVVRAYICCPEVPCQPQSPPIVRGDVLSWLGFSLGSSVQAVSDYFLDAAFVGSQVTAGIRPPLLFCAMCHSHAAAVPAALLVHEQSLIAWLPAKPDHHVLRACRSWTCCCQRAMVKAPRPR